MGLLHSKGIESLPAALWELEKAAKAAGIPLPPPLKLPDLPPIVGGCDVNALVGALGPIAARELAGQLKLPGVRGLLTGNLEEAKGALLGYLGQLDSMKSGLLGQAMEATGLQGAIGQGRDLLSGLRGALGQPLGSPLAGEVLGAVAGACPAVGGLLAYAENTLSALDGQLSGVEGMLGGLVSKLDSLTSVRGLAEGLLGELEAHLDIQGTLFAALDAMDFDALIDDLVEEVIP